MEYKCPKCGSDNIVLSLKRRMESIKNDTYIILCPKIKPFMNNNSRGDTTEIYHEFLLCNCKRCGAIFFEPTLDSDLGDK